MGKSLSMLSLIVDTLENGHEWASQEQQALERSGSLKQFSRATLIVVSSACAFKDHIGPRRYR